MKIVTSSMVMMQLFVFCRDVSLKFLHKSYCSDSVSCAAAADSIMQLDECDINTDGSHFMVLRKSHNSNTKFPF
jgi:hypothetical protein